MGSCISKREDEREKYILRACVSEKCATFSGLFGGGEIDGRGGMVPAAVDLGLRLEVLLRSSEFGGAVWL